MDVLVVEPDHSLRGALCARFAALSGRVKVLQDPAQARELAMLEPNVLVLVRNAAGAQAAAELACGFDLRPAGGVRLVLLGVQTPALATGRGYASYLHEVDLCASLSRMPPTRAEPGAPEIEPAADFPRDAFLPMAHLGSLGGSEIYLCRNRLTLRNELVVQSNDADPSSPSLLEVLYAEFAPQGAAGHVLRHEVAATHSFVSARALPFDLAAKVRRRALHAELRLGRAA
jgi:hypothetical protein